MRVGNLTMDINNRILDLTDHLVSISDFSKGKTAKIFDNVKNNNDQYVVLKNNQPTAMLVSLDMYKELIDKATKMERLLEKIEEIRLLEMASSRVDNMDSDTSKEHDEFVRELGFDPVEMQQDYDNVEIE